MLRKSGETWLWRCAHRIKPATDIHLGMSFTAKMPGSSRVSGFRIPAVYGEIGIPTSNHEPVGRIGRNQSTDFTPEFLQGGHGSVPGIGENAYSEIEACRRSGVRIVISATCSLFTLPLR